jgi:hypothetical protein
MFNSSKADQNVTDSADVNGCETGLFLQSESFLRWYVGFPDDGQTPETQ